MYVCVFFSKPGRTVSFLAHQHTNGWVVQWHWFLLLTFGIWMTYCGWPSFYRSMASSLPQSSQLTIVSVDLLDEKFQRKQGRPEVNGPVFCEPVVSFWNKPAITWWGVPCGQPDTFLEWWDRFLTMWSVLSAPKWCNNIHMQTFYPLQRIAGKTIWPTHPKSNNCRYIPVCHFQ